MSLNIINFDDTSHSAKDGNFYHHLHKNHSKYVNVPLLLAQLWEMTKAVNVALKFL